MLPPCTGEQGFETSVELAPEVAANLTALPRSVVKFQIVYKGIGILGIYIFYLI